MARRTGELGVRSGAEIRRRRWLAAVLFVALVIRIAWSLAIDVDSREHFHFDMTWYDLAALTLLDGRVLRDTEGVPTAFWPPAYPALLAGAYALFGDSLRTGQVLNAVLAVLTCWLTYRLGARLLGSGRGVLAAGILALFPGYVFYAPLTLSENAFVALLAGILVLLARINASTTGGRRRWFGLGALIGVAMLTRGTASLLLVVPFGVWWLESRSLRTALSRTAFAGLGAALVILPWTVRNTVAMGSPVLVSTSIGMALSHAHSPVADGSESLAMVAYRRELMKDLAQLPNPEREVREMWRGVEQALRYFTTHPIRELELIPRRLYHLLEHDHAGLEWATPRASVGARSLADSRPGVVLAGIADFWFFAVLLFAALGALAWPRPGAGAPLVLLTVAYFALLHGVLFVGNPRYHAPLYPVLALLAAQGLCAARHWMSRRGSAPQSR